MRTRLLALHFTPESQWVCLRELCGHDELSVSGTGTLNAIGLVNRLLVEHPVTTISSGKANTIATADRDRLLADLYGHTWGNQIDSTISCSHCNHQFDLNFLLNDLQLHLYESLDKNLKIESETKGIFQLPTGQKFRLPTGEDECAIVGLSPEQAVLALKTRCLLDKEESHHFEEDLFEQIAPLIETDMLATCPECEQSQNVQFDIQSWLLTTIQQEQQILIREVHQLAMSYKWSHQEILDLPRYLRRKYVRLIEASYGLGMGN